MNTYTVTPKNDEFTPFAVEAETISEAASIAARRLHRRRGVFANRVTGSSGLSGWFRAFVPLRGDKASTSIGEDFHVA